MGLEEILKQVKETGREKAAAIRKETTDDVESKMKEASVEAKNKADSIMDSPGLLLLESSSTLS